jgi:aspartyl-tRNA(Asn)/glutamyl-tRNA(Gln) amidotransferase subunit C
MAATRGAGAIDVRAVAALARLELTPAEVIQFERQLTDILAYAEAVQQVETTDVPPTSHAGGGEPIWRADDPRPSLEREVVLSGAPEASVKAGLFKVPKVL